MGSAYTLVGLKINGYSGTLELDADLTLNGNSSMTASIAVIYQNPGKIEIKGGTFSWNGGDINYFPSHQATVLNSFIIDSGGEADFNDGPTTSYIGDNITNNGTLKLANGNQAIALYNQPTITNNNIVQVTATSNGGLILSGTSNPVAIQNDGPFTKILASGSGSYSIADPIVNQAGAVNGGTIEVDAGTLAFTGQVGTGPSVDQQAAAGTQSAGKIAITGGTTLEADHGVHEEGGVVETLGGGTASISYGAQNPPPDPCLWTSNGTVQAGQSTPTIQLAILDVAGNFKFDQGTATVVYNTNTNNIVTTPCYIQADGATGITITKSATTMNVIFAGSGGQPTTAFNVMYASNGTISNICGTNPANFTASIVGRNYQLLKNGLSPSRRGVASKDAARFDRFAEPNVTTPMPLAIGPLPDDLFAHLDWLGLDTLGLVTPGWKAFWE